MITDSQRPVHTKEITEVLVVYSVPMMFVKLNISDLNDVNQETKGEGGERGGRGSSLVDKW